MSAKFKENTGNVLGEEFSSEMGEVSFHGDTRDCVRTHSAERRSRGR